MAQRRSKGAGCEGTLSGAGASPDGADFLGGDSGRPGRTHHGGHRRGLFRHRTHASGTDRRHSGKRNRHDRRRCPAVRSGQTHRLRYRHQDPGGGQSGFLCSHRHRAQSGPSFQPAGRGGQSVPAERRYEKLAVSCLQSIPGLRGAVHGNHEGNFWKKVLLLLLSPTFYLGYKNKNGKEEGMKQLKVMLWFDVEDFITPEADDALLALMEMMDSLGIRGSLKIVGEKIRGLRDRRRTDILEKTAVF